MNSAFGNAGGTVFMDPDFRQDDGRLSMLIPFDPPLSDA
jgi:hypothetical protein